MGYSYEDFHFTGKLLRIQRKRLAFHKLSNAIIITSTDNSSLIRRSKEADIECFVPNKQEKPAMNDHYEIV